MSTFFDLMRKTQEAQAVRLGLPIDRKFSDDELAESMIALSDAERELYGLDPRDESGCPLSPPEMQKLRELEGKMIAFRVTITLSPDRVETINVLAANAVSANVLVVDQLFGDCFDTDKMQSFKIKVEPLKRAA